MPAETAEEELPERLTSLIDEEVARRCAKVEEDYRMRREESERRVAKLEKKLRRLKMRSAGITDKTQGKRMVPDAGSTSGSQHQQQQQEEEEERPTKTKFVWLSQRATDFIMARSVPPRPQIPSHMLSSMGEPSQELYRRFVASSEKIDRIFERMRAQGHRHDYIEVEVADDDAEE